MPRPKIRSAREGRRSAREADAFALWRLVPVRYCAPRGGGGLACAVRSSGRPAVEHRGGRGRVPSLRAAHSVALCTPSLFRCARTAGAASTIRSAGRGTKSNTDVRSCVVVGHTCCILPPAAHGHGPSTHTPDRGRGNRAHLCSHVLPQPQPDPSPSPGRSAHRGRLQPPSYGHHRGRLAWHHGHRHHHAGRRRVQLSGVSSGRPHPPQPLPRPAAAPPPPPHPRPTFTAPHPPTHPPQLLDHRRLYLDPRGRLGAEQPLS